MTLRTVHVMHEPYDVYIGREMPGFCASKWQNPFKIDDKQGRQDVLLLYENYIRSNKQLLNELVELDGKVLGCWCKPKPCHGDILIKLLQELKLGISYD